MKRYLSIIKTTQRALLGTAIATMILLPLMLVFRPTLLTDTLVARLFDLSHMAVFFVMIIRPLADIFLGVAALRPLVILRKGVGVLSAAIPVSFIFAKLMTDAVGYLYGWTTSSYWSLEHFALLAHLADLSALILLITSNNLSKRILGKGWKRVQRLSYVYFYASSFYVLFALHNTSVVISLLLVTALTVIAFTKNKARRNAQLITQPA